MKDDWIGPGKLLVRNETRNSVLGQSVVVADSSSKRRKGLLGRDSLLPGQGLWIIPCQGVHTFAMKFPIDVLYLDRKKKVRKIRRAMMPWHLSISLLSHSVLELPSGIVQQTGTKAGDQLSLSPSLVA